MADDRPDPASPGADALEAGPQSSDATPPASHDPSAASDHPSVAGLVRHFGDGVIHSEVTAGDQVSVIVDAARILAILEWLKTEPDQHYEFLSDLTAVDFGGGRPLQVVYQLWSLAHRRSLRVKAELAVSALQIDSVVPLWKTADWLEREVYDLFGIEFVGHPDLRRILMPENYAEGHPLRKDFPLRGRFSRAEQTRRALSQNVEDFYIPMEMELGREPQTVQLPSRGSDTDPDSED